MLHATGRTSAAIWAALALFLPSGGIVLAQRTVAGSPVYDTEPRSLPRIPVGTVIGDRAPTGWSHLVIKSQPRVAEGDADQVSELVKSLARFLSVTVLATVDVDRAAQPPSYYLKDVAVGLGTRIGDRDIIITSETQDQQGANLGFLARAVLGNTEKELAGVKELVRSPTMLVFDVPSVVLHQGTHRSMALRHALLVDAATGRAFTLLWLIDKDDSGAYADLVGPLNLVEPNTVEDRVLSVDADEFIIGIPSSKAFAIVRIPPGTALAPPAALRPIAAAARLTPASARQLEAGLRALVRSAFVRRGAAAAAGSNISVPRSPPRRSQ